MSALMVFLGGGLGSALRFWVQSSLGSMRGTLIVNLVGSFLVGFVIEKWTDRESVRLFLAAGVLGGFTTFSAFSYETWKTGDLLRASLYVVASVLGAIALCALGTYLGRGQ